MNEDGHVKLLNHIRDDLRTLPQILTAIQNREASLVTNESYITHCPNFQMINLFLP